MDRWGCIRFPELPLQVALLRRQGDGPFAVVRDERPSSPLLHVDPAAREQGLRPGMRYAAALSVVPLLHVDTVTARELDDVRTRVIGLLAEWSPRVEPCAFDSEVFWIDASGLSALHGAPERWGAALRDRLTTLGYRVDLVVGFSRRGSYVLVRSWRRSAVVARPESERRAVAASPVAALPLAWPLLELLDRLEVRTVAELDAIPVGELSRRLNGEALAALNALNTSLPLQPVRLPMSTTRERYWDDPATDTAGLGQALNELLAQVLEELRPRARLIETLTFELVQEDGVRTETLQPARATASARTWRRLLELRLSSLELTAGVVGLRLDTVSVSPPPPAADLFDRPRRDLARGEKALALIQARWGGAVVRAEAVDAHAPERAFEWKPARRLTPPRPGAAGWGAVRRLFDQPRACMDAGVLAGPFVFQGTAEGEDQLRRYWFVRDGNEVLWVRQDGWGEPLVAGAAD